MVVVTSPNKPLPLTPKNTLIRKAALALYEQEVEDCYAGLERKTEVEHDVVLSAGCDERTVLSFVQEVVRKVMDRKVPERLSDDADLFQYGLDS